MSEQDLSFKLFATRSAGGLRDRVLQELGKLNDEHGNPLGRSEDLEERIRGDSQSKNFRDGEPFAQIGENVRHANVYLLGQIYNPGFMSYGDSMAEMESEIGAIARNIGTKGILNLVTPMLPNSRGDIANGRSAVSLRDFFDKIQTLGVDSTLMLEPHSKQVSLAHDNRFAGNVLDAGLMAADYFTELLGGDPKSDYAVISPDVGGFRRVSELGEHLGCYIFPCHKKRDKDGVIEEHFLIGDKKDVAGKWLILYDDIIDSGGTMLNVAEMLSSKRTFRGKQPNGVYCFAAHGLFTDSAEEKFRNAYESGAIKGVVVTDSVVQTPEFYERNKDWLTVISAAPLLANGIMRDVTGGSIHALNTDRGVTRFRPMSHYQQG